MIYQPDTWVIVKLSFPEGKTDYRVAGGWAGGYLHGNSWRLNSGIKSYSKEGDTIEFFGHSSSIYKVHEEAERISAANQMAVGYVMNAVESGQLKEAKVISFKEFEEEFDNA